MLKLVLSLVMIGLISFFIGSKMMKIAAQHTNSFLISFFFGFGGAIVTYGSFCCGIVVAIISIVMIFSFMSSLWGEGVGFIIAIPFLIGIIRLIGWVHRRSR